MVDVISTNENLVLNTGEGVSPSPPPSSSETSNASEVATRTSKTGVASEAVTTTSTQVDASVELTPQARDTLENSDQQKKEGQEDELQKELVDTVERLNEKLTRLDREILLKVDQRIGKNYISVVEKETQEIIREFPPEEVRSFIARFTEFNEKLASVTDLRSLIVNLEV
jgi:flagellar protein FlaG